MSRRCAWCARKGQASRLIPEGFDPGPGVQRGYKQGKGAVVKHGASEHSSRAKKPPGFWPIGRWAGGQT